MYRLSRLKRYVVLGSAAAAAHGVDVGTFGDIDVLTSEEEVNTILEDGDVQLDLGCELKIPVVINLDTDYVVIDGVRYLSKSKLIEFYAVLSSMKIKEKHVCIFNELTK